MKAERRPKQNFALWRSMTYRLPATYAAMALLVALSLGAVLQTTLRTVFAARERTYLANNAEPMVQVLEMLLENESYQLAEEQLNFFSFLVRAKIELLDTEGQVIAAADIFEKEWHGQADYSRAYALQADNPMDRFDFIISPLDSAASEANDATLEASSFLISPLENPVDEVADEIVVFYPAMPGENIDSDAPTIRFAVGGQTTGDMSFQVRPSVFGYDISRDDRRSDQIVEQNILSADGTLLGILRLSKGPSYGVSVVQAIMSGWLLASIVSVALAIIVSWFVSRDVVHPLTALSKTTQRMATGDLSARADIERKDEFGTLSQSFNDMAQRIEETVHTLQQFVSDAAHEINTPITALRTNLELLQSEPDAETLERAIGQLKRLENLAKNLLQLSRLESALDGLEMEEVDIVPIVRDVAQFHASQADQAGINFVLKLPEEQLFLNLNGTQFQQAVSNLVHNAIKFTPNGGQITIQLRQESEEVHLTIEDTGIGIPEADLAYLFNRFHRGRNAARYVGSGLGLAIVQTIVHSFGGQVQAKNSPDGACFTMILPRNITQ